VEAITPVIKHLVQTNISLSIENTPLTAPEDFNSLFVGLGLLEPAAKRRVGMCLDSGHANLYQGTLNEYLMFIDQIDSQVPIIHVHLHKNYGDTDSHLPLFNGPAEKDAFGIQGLLKRLIRRNFSGCLILEYWPQPPTLLNEARDTLRAMIRKITPTAEGNGANTADHAPLRGGVNG
jgi:sugar phosphate isomerase/epimerase